MFSTPCMILNVGIVDLVSEMLISLILSTIFLPSFLILSISSSFFFNAIARISSGSDAMQSFGDENEIDTIPLLDNLSIVRYVFALSTLISFASALAVIVPVLKRFK